MAWLAPMTFLSNTALTAAQLNTFVRDNFNATAPAKATSAGNWFISDGIGSVQERRISSAEFNTSQSVDSTDFVDLSTVTSVSVTTGANAIVSVSADCVFSGTFQTLYVGFAVTGATTIAASKDVALKRGDGASGGRIRCSFIWWLTGLNTGLNTFTMKYAKEDESVTGGSFIGRQILVMAL